MRKGAGRILGAVLALVLLDACAVQPGTPGFSPYTGDSRSNVQIGGAGGMGGTGGGAAGGGM